MDNINDMLNSVLGDPESLQQIKELADMLRAETESGTGAQPAPAPEGGADSGMDPAMLIKLMSAVSAAGAEDKDRALLLALKPYLSPERQEKADKAAKLLRLYAIVTELGNSGMLGELNKFF